MHAPPVSPADSLTAPLYLCSVVLVYQTFVSLQMLTSCTGYWWMPFTGPKMIGVQCVSVVCSCLSVICLPSMSCEGGLAGSVVQSA